MGAGESHGPGHGEADLAERSCLNPVVAGCSWRRGGKTGGNPVDPQLCATSVSLQRLKGNFSTSLPDPSRISGHGAIQFNSEPTELD